MAKFPEASARLFYRVYVCRRCKTKQRSDVNKILSKKISCRKCSGKNFRPIKAKK